MHNWYQKKILPKLLNSGMGSKELEDIRRNVLVDATGIVLEIGVGPGFNIPLYKNITKLYALEPMSELVAIAKTRTTTAPFEITFLHAPAEHIPLPDQAVDTVVSTWTLCSVTDPKKVLDEIARVLRPQGLFIFAEHGASHSSVIHVSQTFLTSITKYFTGNCHYNRSIKKLIRNAGFTIQKMEHPHQQWKPLMYHYQGVAIKQS